MAGGLDEPNVSHFGAAQTDDCHRHRCVSSKSGSRPSVDLEVEASNVFSGAKKRFGLHLCSYGRSQQNQFGGDDRCCANRPFPSHSLRQWHRNTDPAFNGRNVKINNKRPTIKRPLKRHSASIHVNGQGNIADQGTSPPRTPADAPRFPESSPRWLPPAPGCSLG